MRKLFLPVGVLLVLALAFTACEQTTDSHTIVTHGGLPGFDLDAKVYSGGALLTWDIVIDAARYDVWRQKSGEANIHLGSVGQSATTRFVDVKSRLNNLEADVDYKYTVVAVSNASTSVTEAPEIFQNSKSEKTVKFTAEQLPSTINLSPVSNLKLEVRPDSSVLATWDADANPLVGYWIQNNTNGGGGTWASVETPVAASDTVSATLSTAGGTFVTASVIKVLDNGEGDIAFYNPSNAVEATITVFFAGGFEIIAYRDNNSQVKLTLWNIPYSGLGNFELSRYRLAASPSENPSWTSVSLANAQLMTDGDETYYELYDALPANSQNATFQYRLVGKYPGVTQISSVAYMTVYPLIETPMSLRTITLTATANGRYSDSPNESNDDLAMFFYLSHNIEDDVDYAYFRRQASGANGIPLPANVAYDWEPITSEDTNTGISFQTIRTSVSAARMYYDFKVIATGKNSKAGYRGVEDTATSRISPAIGLSGTTINAAGYYDYATAYSTTVGYRRNNNGDITGTVYALNLTGLKAAIGSGLLREGEALTIELVPNSGASFIAPINVTRNTSFIHIINEDDDVERVDQNTLRYYYYVPNTSVGYYTARLHVTAR